MIIILYHTLTIARLYINIYNEYMLKELFYECAYKGGWTTINNVDFKFIEHDETLEIYFQGSYQWQDWVFNFLFAKRVYKMYKVHRGFYYCYSQVRSIILDKCYSKPYKKIIIVGYSHGGSLCQLALEDILWHFPSLDIKGYAFESPRCLKVPKKYKSLWGNLTRIVDGCDIVCHCPPKLFGFDDLGTAIKIKGDTKLVDKWYLPRFIKYHYPQVVMNGLEKENL